MKVTFCAFDHSNKVGGPLAWLIRLLPALQDRGVSTKVLFLTTNPLNTPTADALRDKGVEVVVNRWHQDTRKITLWILEQLKEDPPDVFVPNLMVPAYYAAAWVRDAGIPTVGILHSDDDFYRGLQDEFVFGEEFFHLSGLVCVSEHLTHEVLQKKPLDVEVRKIPYGAPLPAEKNNSPQKVLKLAYVGRLVEEQKRISDVIRALCRVVKEVPEVEATIFGDGPARPSVENILANEGRGLLITLAGIVPSEEVQKHLLEHHVLVLLSDYEGLPIALMEAMACGLVPVCSDMRSGIPELVKNESNGLIVNDREDSFVGAIRRLKNDSPLWEKLSAAAREKIEQGYSSEVGVEGWVKFLSYFHSRTTEKTEIQVPLKLNLPPVHPGLAREDFRKKSLPVLLQARIARFCKKHFVL